MYMLIIIFLIVISLYCFYKIDKESYKYTSIKVPVFLDTEDMFLYLDTNDDIQVNISDTKNNIISSLPFQNGRYYLDSTKNTDKVIIDNLRTFGINLSWNTNNMTYTSTLKINGSESNMRMIYFQDDNINGINPLIDSGLNTILPVGFYPTPDNFSNIVSEYKDLYIIFGIAPIIENNYNQGNGKILTDEFKNNIQRIINIAKNNTNVIGYYTFDEALNKFSIEYQIMIYNYIRSIDKNSFKRPIFQADTMWIGINGNCKGDIDCIKRYKSQFAQDILLTDQYWGDRNTLDNYFNIISRNDLSKCVIPVLSAYTNDCDNFTWDIDKEYEINKNSIISNGFYFYPNSIGYFAYWKNYKPDFKFDASNCSTINSEVINNLNTVSGNCKHCKNICYNNACISPKCTGTCGIDGLGGWCGCTDQTKVCRNDTCLLRKGQKCDRGDICEIGYYCENNTCRSMPIS